MAFRALLALALAAGLTVPAAAQEKMERAGITNYTKVSAVVACGGATETAALEALKQDGFKTVINLRLAMEKGANVEENAARAKELGLNYVHIPVGGDAPPERFEQFLATIADTSNQPVFIHCASANRVGMMWMVKRVLQDGWDVEKAADEAHAIGLTSQALEAAARKYIAEHKK